MIAANGIGVGHVTTQNAPTPPGALTMKNEENSITFSLPLLPFPDLWNSIRERVSGILERVNLSDDKNRNARTLSGGKAQRGQ
ncbi:MAG: hypothetical protein QMC90_04470 [Dehalococcoidales bacterium]|nr:hypothetical protein [Dehalococcoidales bacterium]